MPLVLAFLLAVARAAWALPCAPSFAQLAHGDFTVEFRPASAERAVPELELRRGSSSLRLEVWGADAIHLEWTAKGTDFTKPIWTSPMVGTAPTGAVATWDGAKLETSAVSIEVDPSDASVTMRNRATGQIEAILRPKNLGNDWKTIEIETEAKHALGLGEYFRAGNTDVPWVGDKAVAGEQGNAHLGYYGGCNSYTQFPVVYGLHENGRSFALFLDQAYKVEWDLTDRSRWRASTWGDQVRAFFFSGGDLPNLRARYMDLTGKPPVPPWEVFGFGLSQFGYSDWAEVDRDLEEMRRAAIPVSLVGLDLAWFGGKFDYSTDASQMGTMRFDPVRFPNPEQKIRELLAQGTAVLPINESYVDGKLPEFEWGKQQGIFAVDGGSGQPSWVVDNNWWGRGPMIDWSSPKTDAWVREKHGALMGMGIAGFWNDLGEPEMRPPGDVRYHGFPELGKHGHGDVHNVYNLFWAKRMYETLSAMYPEKRLFTLNRSGTSGLQRFGGGKWGGDTGGGFQELIGHLQNRIRNLPLVGIDYYSSDIGGFHRGNDERWNNEVYTQWLANSLLLDFPARVHTWNLAKNRPYLPTRIGHVPSNLANLKLRYELMPYFYNLAHGAYERAEPLVAPLVFWHQNDPVVRDMGHEAMLGRDLLMGIVAKDGETARSVYLPEGDWFDYHAGGGATAGKRWLDSVGLWRDGIFRLPLYARAGAILPLLEGKDPRTVFTGESLRLRIFPSAEGSSRSVVEDDGRTTSYRIGVRRTEVTQRLSGDRVQVEISPASGYLAGAPATRSLRVEIPTLGRRAESVTWNGTAVPFEQSGGYVAVRFPSASASEAHSLEFRLVP